MLAAVRTPAPQLTRIDGRLLHVSRLEKPLWPADGITKATLMDYFLSVAPALLPHLADRLLTVTRFPDGIEGHAFYQKHRPRSAPEWVPSHRVPAPDSQRGYIDYVLAQDRPTLAWLANEACIELHPSLARVPHLDRPDFLVVDLDPMPPAGFAEARRVAFLVRELLERVGLRGYPKTSGATGIHIYVPLEPRYPYRVTKTLALRIAEHVARALPDTATDARRIRDRGGRVYVDALQNLPGKTLVAPYSPRPLPGAPVSTPVTWEELQHVEPAAFTLRTVPERLRRFGDRFAPLLEDRQRLDTAWKRFGLPGLQT